MERERDGGELEETRRNAARELSFIYLVKDSKCENPEDALIERRDERGTRTGNKKLVESG